MKIQIYSDFVCPFCYIGKARLEKALSQSNLDAQIELKSFELDPNRKPYSGEKITEVIAQKYGISEQESEKINENINQNAADVGIKINFDDMKCTNTLNAHRLAKFAASKGKELKLSDELFKAYFTLGANLSDEKTLLEISQKAGLNKDEAKAVLDDEQAFLDDVRRDEYEARLAGISSVPCFIIDERLVVRGALPVEELKRAFKQAGELSGKTCGDLACDV